MDAVSRAEPGIEPSSSQSSSFVLYSTGLILLVLPLLMGSMEVMDFKRWTYFFEAFGKNPLFIYVLAGVIIRIMSLLKVEGKSLNGWIYEQVVYTGLGEYNASLLFAFCYMPLMWFGGYRTNQEKVYIKV